MSETGKNSQADTKINLFYIMNSIQKYQMQGAIEYGRGEDLGSKSAKEKYYSVFKSLIETYFPKGDYQSNLLKRISECQNCAKA